MRYILLILCCSITLNIGAQTTAVTEFPKDAPGYLKALDNFLNATKREDCKVIYNEFAALHKAGKIPSDRLDKIIVTSNTMLKEKMRAFPHVSSYIEIINSLTNSGQAEAQFNYWNEVVDKLLFDQKRGSYKDYDNFMSFSKSLFEKNAIYDSKAKTWVASNKDFRLGYEDKKPKVTFATTTIYCYSSQDTQTIENTTGILYPTENIWEGNKGRVDWSRAGLPEVYADILKPYTIRLDQSEIKIDTVTFYHKQLFDKPLLGSYNDKVMTQQGTRSFPRFNSFENNLDIGDIGPNIKYTGGFMMQGNSFYGAGDEYNPAIVSFFDDKGKRVLTAKSTQFLIKKGESLQANRAEMSLLMGNDSIYHPGVRLIYRFDKKELSLYRESSGIGAAPFYDSYHKKEIHTEAIIWKLNEPTIDMKMMTGGDKNAMEITSDNYFQKGEIEKYQTIKDFSPVHMLNRFADEIGSMDFLAESFAKRLDKGYTESTIKNLLFKLMEDGFIFYDNYTGVITVNDKTKNYVLAHSGKADYDIIKIKSFSDKSNAKINIETNEMEVAGVSMIALSDSSNVYIFPKEKGIIIKENQDMTFSGTVFAGRIDFEGAGFEFDYDSFKIDMTQLASATINIPTGKKDKQGDAEFVPMKSKIEGLTGFLNIDHPKNKSGKQRLERYPIFTNRNKSFVYYDKKEIRDSAYNREKFYFEIDPFEFDSLNSFDPYLADLHGQLISAGIFPDFKEDLKVQEDLSWGFQRVTPKGGFPIYGGKGTYTDSILLSNSGLQGRGHVKHLFIDFSSKDIFFMPDSLDAVSDTFLMRKEKIANVTFPIVKGKDNFIHWLPYNDSMFIKTRTEPLLMYEDGATLKGDLLFTQKALTGNGRFEFTEASLESDLFAFAGDYLQSDTMSMEIKSIGGDQVTFKTPNVRGTVDFAKRQGEFKANNEDIPTEFANNFFKTNINEFFWDMDKKILDFKSPPGSEGAYFTSTHAQKDSLRFMAKRGIFDMTSSIIKVEDVSRFYVADAEIQPDSAKATILPGGNIDTLYNAVIIADTLTKYHRIYGATLYVDARNKYSGTGKYDYRFGDLQQIIELSKIDVKEDQKTRKKKAFTTFAEGMIEEEDSFKIHPQIDFKGLASFTAQDTGVTFDGFAKMKIGEVQTDWFSMKDTIDPKNFLLHYVSPVTPSGDTLTVGFSYTFYTDTPGLYMRLMTPKKNAEDHSLFATTGVIKHDAMVNKYRFGNENKIVNAAPKGNVVVFDEKKKTLTAEGRVDLGLELRPVTVVSSGTILHEIDSNKKTLQLLLGMNLPIEKTLMAQFASEVNSYSFDKPNVDLNSSWFEAAYAEMFSDRGYKSKLEELRKTGTIPLPKEMQSNIVFSNLTLLYDADFQIYRSVGPIGVAYIGETPIMKMLTGYVEFGQRKFNDFFHIYIESTFDDWFYISCQNNTMQMISSKEDFNKLLAAVPAAKRQIPLTKDKKYFFLYTIGSPAAKESFLYRARMIAEGRKTTGDEGEEFFLNQELDALKKQLLQDEEFVPKDVEYDALPSLLFGPMDDDDREPPMDRETPDEEKPVIEEPKGKSKGKAKTAAEPKPEEEPLPMFMFDKPEEPKKEEPVKKDEPAREEPPMVDEEPQPEPEAKPAKKEKAPKAPKPSKEPEPDMSNEPPVHPEVAPQPVSEEPPMSNPDYVEEEDSGKKKKKKE